MTSTNQRMGPRVSSKKQRFTGRGTEPRGRAKKNASAHRVAERDGEVTYEAGETG